MIAAVVLAAGESRRMGRSKLDLPWGSTTVIGQVVSVLAEAGVGEIVVVTGGAHQEVVTALDGLPARTIVNPGYQEGGMLSTLQVGLRALGETTDATLVALGDQPQVEGWVVKSVLSVYSQTRAPIVVPSYRNRRGHPWLLGRSLWPLLLSMAPPAILRDFLAQYADDIQYVTVETGSVVQDLDTPEDYTFYRPS